MVCPYPKGTKYSTTQENLVLRLSVVIQSLFAISEVLVEPMKGVRMFTFSGHGKQHNGTGAGGAWIGWVQYRHRNVCIPFWYGFSKCAIFYSHPVPL